MEVSEALVDMTLLNKLRETKVSFILGSRHIFHLWHSKPEEITYFESDVNAGSR
jgi:hypothetical protein